jgi:hypothetical protein
MVSLIPVPSCYLMEDEDCRSWDITHIYRVRFLYFAEIRLEDVGVEVSRLYFVFCFLRFHWSGEVS